MAHTDPSKPSDGPHRYAAPPGRAAAPIVHRRMLSARGHRGEMRFLLQRVVGGLYVEREDLPRHGSQTLQSLEFVTPDAFSRWCDNDPVRFEYPLLHRDLRRHADELWQLDPPASDAADV